MFKIKLFTLSLLATLSISAVNAAEVIYKWKDSSGNIKFTQSKPRAGIDYITIRNRTETKTSTAKPRTTSKLDEEVSNQQDQVIATQNADKARVDAINAQRAEKNCTISKNNLQALERTTRVQINEDGKRRMLTDQERADKLSEAKKNIEKYCK